MKTLEKVSVFGLGKLGACIAATLAARGFDVLGVDIDPEKVRLVNEGLPPVEEPLLAQTMDIPNTHDGTQALLRIESNDGPPALVFTHAGMIALTGIVFSLAFVMVQFSATAYSPRSISVIASQKADRTAACRSPASRCAWCARWRAWMQSL